MRSKPQLAQIIQGGVNADSSAPPRREFCEAVRNCFLRDPKSKLKEIGWSKAIELVKVARREGENFDCATWLHKAEELPKEEFKCVVERHLNGNESEPWELLYFKVYRSQLRVVEQALETAGLMLGTEKSRGYCLEMICADFLAGASLSPDGNNASTLFLSICSLYKFLTPTQRADFWSRHHSGLPGAHCDYENPATKAASPETR